MFGFSADEVVGRNVKMLMPAPYHREHDGYLARYRETGEKQIIGIGREVVGQRRDGTTFPMDLAVSEFQRGDKVVYTGILRDITERKRIEDRLKALTETLERRVEERTAELRAAQEELVRKERLATLGQLTGSVSHELRNPLGAMRISIAAIKRLTQMDDPLLKDSVANINRSLLSFARRQALRPIEFDLGGYLMQLTEELRRELGDSITCTLSAADDIGHVRLDRDQLGSALRHLVSNAKDAMPRGGRVTIEVSEVENPHGAALPADDLTPGRYVVIAVDDTGSGIPPDIMDRVIEPFFTGKGMAEADGLGLSMVYGFVKQSGGDVSIESEPDKGTTVRLYLPRNPPRAVE